MIVPSMTLEEIYREIEKDMPRVAAWWMRQREVLVKRALKILKFPYTVWFEHKSKRMNHYLVMSIILGRKYDKNSLTSVAALQKMERGYAVYFTKWPWQMVADRIVLMPHVFDRYADPQRGNVQKSGIELIKHFIRHNGYGEPTTDNRFSGRSVRYKGRDNLCLSVPDGVLLGEEIGDIFVAHTFITYEMASGLQREEFEKNKGKLESEQQILHKLRRLYEI